MDSRRQKQNGKEKKNIFVTWDMQKLLDSAPIKGDIATDVGGQELLSSNSQKLPLLLFLPFISDFPFLIIFMGKNYSSHPLIQ